MHKTLANTASTWNCAPKWRLFSLILRPELLKQANSPDMTDTNMSNPFIGTGDGSWYFSGHKSFRHDFSLVGQRTSRLGGTACSGYFYYADSTIAINGFSAIPTFLSTGTCCDLYGDVLSLSRVQTSTTGSQSQQMVSVYASAFSHQDETATAGYYQYCWWRLRHQQSRIDCKQPNDAGSHPALYFSWK